MAIRRDNTSTSFKVKNKALVELMDIYVTANFCHPYFEMCFYYKSCHIFRVVSQRKHKGCAMIICLHIKKSLPNVNERKSKRGVLEYLHASFSDSDIEFFVNTFCSLYTTQMYVALMMYDAILFFI